MYTLEMEISRNQTVRIPRGALQIFVLGGIFRDPRSDMGPLGPHGFPYHSQSRILKDMASWYGKLVWVPLAVKGVPCPAGSPG